MSSKCFVMGLGSIAILAGLIYVVTSFLHSNRSRWSNPLHFRACSQFQIEKMPPKTVCSTAKGGIFELVERAAEQKVIWQDLQTGLLWIDKLAEKYSHNSAIEECRAASRKYFWIKNFRLPTKAEYEIVFAHGFRELLSMRDASEYFWTSTPFETQDRNEHDYLHIRTGDGIFDHADHQRRNPVRCVGRRFFDFDRN